MPQRPQRSLAVVGVLALGDYLLWNWSIGANHDVAALVSGMTLIPLLIALAWLLLVAVARLVGNIVQQPTKARAAARPRGDARAGGRARRRSRTAIPRAFGANSPGEIATGASAAATNAAATVAAGAPYAALGDPAPAAATGRTAASPSSKLAA